MEIYFPIKDLDSKDKTYYQLVNFNGEKVTDAYKGMFGLFPFSKDVADKIKRKELGDYLIVDMSLGVFDSNSHINKLSLLNSLEYEFFHILIRVNLRRKEKK